MAAEQLRRLLLKEMGITSWFPRTPLPGAALSHEQCLQNFLEDAPVRTGTVVTESAPGPSAATKSLRESNAGSSALLQAAEVQRPSAPNPGVAQLAELLGKKPAVPASISAAAPTLDRLGAQPVDRVMPVTQSEQGARSDANAQSDDAGTFGFSWFNVDKRLAVLAMLPEGNTRLTGSCRQMLARMLAALHTPWQTLDLSDQSFHWPFADDLGLPADAAAARQAIDGFIARRLREQNCAMLLVLCDGLPWFLQSAAGAPSAAGAQLQVADPEGKTRLRVHRQFGFAMLATHSLHAMEKDAGLKREAWQSMQLLRERLNRND